MGKAEEVPVRLRHDESVGTLAFSPDGATLATGSLDANLRLWDVGAALAGEARRELIRQPAGVTALAWADGGESILTGHSSRVLRLLDPHRARLLKTLRGPEGLVSLLTLSPDGRFMAVASHDRTVRLFDLATREPVGPVLTELRRPATSMCFLADGGFLATVCQENAVQLWDLETGTPGATLWGPADESFVGLALFGESNHLAVALGDGRIRVWGRPLRGSGGCSGVWGTVPLGWRVIRNVVRRCVSAAHAVEREVVLHRVGGVELPEPARHVEGHGPAR
jgi:WD40 repeat protein